MKLSKLDIARMIAMGLVLVLGIITLFVKQSPDDSEIAGLAEVIEASEKKNDYIIHALGGMDGESSYINSIDSLEKTYDAGFRLFEADVSFTSDGVLVLAHSGENNVWSENDWKLRLGQSYPFSKDNMENSDDKADNILEQNEMEYDIERHLVTYEEFMNFNIQGKYKATDFAELLDFMEEHTDMYVMVDAGLRSYVDTKLYYEEIVHVANGRTEVLDRLIAGGQTTEMVKAAKEAYDFPLINLYYAADDKREEIIATPELFIEYCEENGISSFSISKDVYTAEVAAKLEKSSLISYVFTVNDRAEEERIRGYGADIIGTDFLWDKDYD